MAFFGKIKRAFGFSNDDIEEEIEGIDATVRPYQPKTVDNSNQDDGPDVSDSDAVAERIAANMTNDISTDQIFSSVVKIFNDTLPDFLRAGINEDAQRKYLYESLDNSIKEYLDKVKNNAREMCRVEWENERKRLLSETSSLRDKVKSVEESSSENKRQQLSAERQKRALSERIHDLESKITELEAEKEQYELENRSLINKLRVSNVMSDLDCDAVDKINELNKTVETLTHQNSELNTDISQLKAKIEMSDVMINDLNARASAAQADLASREKEIEEFKANITAAQQRERVLHDKFTDLSAELDSTRNELEEAHSAMSVVEEIQKELDKFEDIKNSKNNQISELQLSLRKRDERIVALEVELRSLHESMESSNSKHHESEERLADEIKRLNKVIEMAGAGKESKKRKRPPVKISAIDEDLDSTDWLVATPPEGTNARPGGVADNEFGYQEPVRKNPPENSAQMSLW